MSALEISLTAAHAEVKAEIARTDTKASLLLAFVGALLAGVWTVVEDSHLPAAALAVSGAGAVLLVLAAWVLLLAVRPNLGGRQGFPLWATLTVEEIRTELGTDRRAQDIAGLSRIAVAKFTRLKRAVDLLCTGGALLIVAAVITAGGAL